jgi:hypothetical protein
MGMADTVEDVWFRLVRFKESREVRPEDRCTITPEDEAYLRKNIAQMLAAGWTAGQVFAHLKWTEYFDEYGHTEDYCLHMLTETSRDLPRWLP